MLEIQINFEKMIQPTRSSWKPTKLKKKKNVMCFGEYKHLLCCPFVQEKDNLLRKEYGLVKKEVKTFTT
jgi:hypothetical protein